MTQENRLKDATRVKCQDLGKLKDGNILIKGEAPEHIIGFSMNFSTQPYEIYYHAIRVEIPKEKEKLEEKVQEVVKGLQSKVQKGSFVPRNNLSETDFAYLQSFMSIADAVDLGFRKNSNFKQNCNIEPRLPYIYSKGLDRTLYGKNRKPLLKVDRPTLFVFTTNLGKSGVFGGEYMTDHDGGSSKLDPNLMNMRTWDDGKIFAVYSDYSSSGDSQSNSEFWYYLHLQIKLFKGDDKNTFVNSFTSGSFFDPGNGTGGGGLFP